MRRLKHFLDAISEKISEYKIIASKIYGDELYA